jgi:hypothetical protein
MAMSALSAPIYLKSLGEAVLRRPSRFVVTPKGDDASPDRLLTFRIHLFWAGLLATSLTASVILDNTHAAMRTWALLATTISLAPVAVWCSTLLKERREAPPLPVLHAPPRRGEGAEPALAGNSAGTTVAGSTTGGN